MNIDTKKIKNNEQDIMYSYISEDNTVLEIPEEKIYMEFNINGHNYIAFTEEDEFVEEMEMMFAKVDFIYGGRIIRNIENEQEYETVVKEFKRRLELMLD